MCQKLVTLLCGGIEADGVVVVVLCWIWNFFIVAIDTAGTGINEVPNTLSTFVIAVSARFKDVVKPEDVALNVSIGVFDAVADSGLRCQVDYNIKFMWSK